MKIKVIDVEFSVCKLKTVQSVDLSDSGVPQSFRLSPHRGRMEKSTLVTCECL